MARQISFIVTNDGAICAFANGKAFQPVGKDHPNYPQIKEAIQNDDVAALTRLTDIPRAVTNFAKGKVEVKDGIVYYSGSPLHNGLTDRILMLMREQFPFEPMLRFLERVMKNPSYRARNELYDFLAHRALPITEDGYFLAYKHVRDDFKDIYSGKFDNSIGKVVEMDRGEVDDNREVGCSNGLHVGAIEYVKTYSGSGCDNGGKYIICKVDPADVVSVPKELDCTKLRTCKYEVIGLYEGDLTSPVYTSTGQPSNPGPYCGDDYDDEDEDEDFDEEDEDFDDEDEDEDDDEDFDDEDEPQPTPPAAPVVVNPPLPVQPTTPVQDTGFGLTATGDTKNDTNQAWSVVPPPSGN